MNAFVLVVAMNSWIMASELEGPATAPSSQSSMADAESIQDILYITPRQPLLIRMHAFVNGEGYRSLRRKWADAQFADFDTDHNGVLEGDEIKRLPSPNALRRGVSSDMELTVPADSDPADGKITLEECRRYLIQASGPSFSIVSLDNPQGRIVNFNNGDNVQVNLFPKLDTDRDGKLSKQEIDAAASNLRRYDRNEDDIVDNNELQQSLPEELAASRQQLSGALGMLLVVDTTDGGISTSRRLLESYDKASRDPVKKVFRKDERLTKDELLVDAASFAAADLNGDGKLDRKELGRLPSLMTPHLELEVQSPGAEGVYSVKSTRPVDPSLTSLLDAKLDANGQWVLSLGDTAFGLRTEGPNPGLEESLKNLYVQQFKQLDQDKNDYLELREMQAFGFPETFFSQADTDGDGKVFEKEYVAQVDREIALSKSTYSLEVSSDGPSLFRLIDVNPSDSRLSLRELADAPARFAKWDLNGDGAISLAELSITLQADFKAGTPRVNGPFNPQNLPRIPVRGTRAIGQVIGNLIGAGPPEWFTKMDRNSDGDLSPKEFLGRRALFDKIDTNHDGLISASEAQVANRETSK